MINKITGICMVILFLVACGTPSVSESKTGKTQVAEVAPTNGQPEYLTKIADKQAYIEDGLSYPILGLEDSRQSLYILVRHAEKAKNTADPDLSKYGIRRATHLANLFKRLEIHKIMTTDFKRTRQTVATIAQRQNLEPEVYDPGNQTNYFEAFLRKVPNQTVLIVGHSNTIPALANYLVGEKTLADYAEDAYDDILLISVSEPGNGKLLPLKYK